MKRPVLTYTLVIVVAIVAVFLIVAARQPDTFRVERSTTMLVPAALAFNEVNNFHNWKKWSPYEALDPNMKTTYAGPDSGVGAEMAWSGNGKAGQGSMTIVESRPDELIRMNLEFTKPFVASNIAEFTFKSEGDKTVVTWSMTGPSNFMFKMMHTLMDMDKLVGRDFERGLSNMKAIVERQPQ